MQGPHGEKVVWSTGTHTTGFKTVLELNYAGELILTRIEGGSTVWRSGVTGNGTKFWAQMQDNGNFVVHEGECCDNSTKIIWATNTTQSVSPTTKADVGAVCAACTQGEWVCGLGGGRALNDAGATLAKTHNPN
jgi:hypothetical protein